VLWGDETTVRERLAEGLSDLVGATNARDPGFAGFFNCLSEKLEFGRRCNDRIAQLDTVQRAAPLFHSLVRAYPFEMVREGRLVHLFPVAPIWRSM
jgi:hypothetical protein